MSRLIHRANLPIHSHPRDLRLDAGGGDYAVVAGNPDSLSPRRGHLRRAEWLRVAYGIYRARLDTPSALGDLRGWQLVLPESAAFTHLTGALVRRWWLPPLPADPPVFVGMSNDDPRPRRPGLIVCRHTRPGTSSEVAGLRVAEAPEILLAAARDLGLIDLVVLADAALQLGECTVADLSRVAGHRRRGAPALRRALPYVDPRSESAWESILRLLHQICDVPVEPQYEVRDTDGFLRARADLRITGTRRLPEYDGEAHRHSRQHAKDLTRERQLQDLGWQRYGYNSGVVLHNGLSVLRDADSALGRVHSPERIRAWYRLLGESLFTPAGTARLSARWELAAVGAHVTGQRLQSAATGSCSL